MGNVVQPLWDECPALTRLVLVGYPVLSAFLMLVASAEPSVVNFGFVCTWVTAVENYSVWTLFTSLLYRPFQGGMSFIMTLFELYMGATYFPAREKDVGSSTFLVWLMTIQALCNAVFLLIVFLLSLSDPAGHYKVMPNQGLWPTVMVCLTLGMLANPDSSTSFYGVVAIPNKYYPIALTGFFSLLSMRIAWNFVAAIAIGYAYPYLRIDRLMPSRTRVGAVEHRCCNDPPRRCLWASWVRAADTAAYDLETGDRRYATLADFGRSGGQTLAASGREVSASSQPSSSGGGGGQCSASFVAFGGSGNRLGGDAVTETTQMTELRPTGSPTAQQEGDAL